MPAGGTLWPVKAIIIIADGAGDKPIAALGGRTPLEAAETPNLDLLVRQSGSLMGTAATTPPGFEAGSDVCTMDLLGYDPRRYHTGRAPLEAASIGVDAGPSDWIFRLNLVTVGDERSQHTAGADRGLMLDHSAGAISDAEARTLVADLLAYWRKSEPALVGTADRPLFTLTHGVSYRSILVDHTGRSYDGVRTTPPHEIPRQPFAASLPRALAGGPTTAPESAEVISRLMARSREMLEEHPINRERRARGLRPANSGWIWGQGTKPAMPAFDSRFGALGAMITAVDLLSGIARLIGWPRLDVPGVTSYHDTDYAAQGRATVEALRDFDVVCCHVESPDEASHQADWKTKVEAIESIDRLVVGPVARHLASPDGPAAWRLMVLPDHYTLVSTRKHDATPVPFLIASGPGRSATALGTPGPSARFTEADAGRTGLHVADGADLMSFFLGRADAGQRGAKP